MKNDKDKVIGYIRVSTEEQAREGYSLENQETDIKKYCELRDWELIGIFSDEGISGASLNERNGIVNALRYIKEEDIKYLIVWKLSRLSRKVSDIVEIAEILEQHNSNLISIKDNIDTSTPMGKPFLYIAGIFAEIERENMIIQVKGGMIEKAREGYWNGGNPPLGYDLLNGKLEINNKEAEVVKCIFSEYLKGNGYKTIASFLNTCGYKTKKGNSFNGVAVKEILKNPVYTGKIRWGHRENWNKKNADNKRKRKYSDNPIFSDGIHKPIIDKEIYDKVQTIINNNPRHHVKQFNGNHILSGLLKCPDCGYGMSIQTVKSKNKTYEYYACNQYVNYKKCHSNLIPKNAIEEEFFKVLENIINKKEYKDIIISSFKSENQILKDYQNQIKNFEDRINKINNSVRLLIDELVEEKDKDYKNTIRERIKELLNEKNTLQEKINKTLSTINEIKNSTINTDEFIILLENFSKVIKLSDKKTQRNLITKLVKSIQIKDEKISEITFMFNKSFRIENGTVPPLLS